MIKFVVTYRIYNAAGYAKGKRVYNTYAEAEDHRQQMEEANRLIGFEWYENIKLTKKKGFRQR